MEPNKRSDSRQIIKALRSGATPSKFANRMFVGQDAWFNSALKLMEENAEDQQFEVRFIRAAYGGGKTLFLRRLAAEATARGWATAYILLRHGKVELDKPHTLATELGDQLDLGDQGRGILALLKAALEKKARECGIIAGRTSTLAAHSELENRIRNVCARKLLGNDISVALRQGCRAFVQGNLDRLSEIAQWLVGANMPLVLPSPPGTGTRAAILKPLGIGASEGLMRLVAELALMAGKRGLYIALDEVELIASFTERRRANAFQTLRAFVDQNDPHTLPPATSMFLAATPQIFEDKKMFPSYKALQDRIESLPNIEGKRAINYRANVIDLDATQLSANELCSLGRRIIECWIEAEESVPPDAESQADEIANAIASRNDFMIARPRLYCRLVIDMLDGNLESDVAKAAATRASAIRYARDREVAGQ